jgi:uncharacterized protein (DUF305 family)
MEGHAMEGMMSAEQLQQLEAASGTDAARLFLEQMIEHHRGAVAMAQEQIQDGENAEAVALAEEIVAVQQEEIDTMTSLLENL